MLIVAVILNLIGALGIFALAAKYLFGPVPADYHAAIFEKTAQPVGDGLMSVLTALYRALGAMIAAIGVAIVLLAVFGVWSDLFWAKATVLALVLVSGVPTSLVTFRVSRVTGVETPWKSAVGLTVLGVLAFLLAIV